MTNELSPANDNMLRGFFENVDKVVAGLDPEAELTDPGTGAAPSGGSVGTSAKSEEGSEKPKADGDPKDAEKHAEEAKAAKPEVKAETPPASLAKALAKLAAQEAKLAADRKAFEDERKGVATPKPAPADADLALLFRRSPIEAIKSLGFEDAEAANIFRAGMADIMGDKAPEPYRKIREEQGLEARFRQLEARNQALQDELKARDEAAAEANKVTQTQTIVTQYQQEARKYLGGDASTETPLVARLYAADPDTVIGDLLEVVMADARAKLAAGKTDAAPLTQAEAARVLEARHAKLRDLYGSTNQGPARTPPSLTNSGRTASVQSNQPQDPVEFDIDKAAAAALKKWGISN